MPSPSLASLFLSLPSLTVMLAISLALAPNRTAAAPATLATSLTRTGPILEDSLVLEARSALRRGAGWLRTRQQGDGTWGEHPALTSLAALALYNLPEGVAHPETTAAADRAADWLVRRESAQPEVAAGAAGPTGQYAVLSRAVGTWAVIRRQRPEDFTMLKRVRNSLWPMQIRVDSDLGCGGFRPVPGAPPDLVTTGYVLETLYLTDFLDRPPLAQGDAAEEEARGGYLTARRFLAACWVTPAPTEGAPARPRFQSRPAAASGDEAARQTEALLTAVGVKSLLYAGVAPGDPILPEALARLGRELEPTGFLERGGPGYFTWLHATVQALQAAEHSPAWAAAKPAAPPGTRAWRERVALELLRRQNGDGSWRQVSPDGWETRPELSTAYALLALELCLRE